MQDQTLKKLIYNEVEIMKSFKHENIVKLLVKN